MKSALFFAICYCLVGSYVNAQTDFTYYKTGAVSDLHFTMGKTGENKDANIAIRTDSLYWSSINDCAIRNRNNIEFWDAFSRNRIKISTDGIVEKIDFNPGTVIDMDYLSAKIKQKHLVLYGKPMLSGSEKHPINTQLPKCD